MGFEAHFSQRRCLCKSGIKKSLRDLEELQSNQNLVQNKRFKLAFIWFDADSRKRLFSCLSKKKKKHVSLVQSQN